MNESSDFQPKDFVNSVVPVHISDDGSGCEIQHVTRSASLTYRRGDWMFADGRRRVVKRERGIQMGRPHLWVFDTRPVPIVSVPLFPFPYNHHEDCGNSPCGSSLCRKEIAKASSCSTLHLDSSIRRVQSPSSSRSCHGQLQHR